MNILVACEESQAVTKAFRAKGHNAFSCDILPCSGGHPEWHIQGDVMRILSIHPMRTLLNSTNDRRFCITGWDMVIAHPPCTYLCNSGVRWLAGNAERAAQMHEAALFFKGFIKAQKRDGFKLAIENPIPHKHGGATSLYTDNSSVTIRTRRNESYVPLVVRLA